MQTAYGHSWRAWLSTLLPVILTHARDRPHGVPDTTIIGHDLRDPARILADPGLRAVESCRFAQQQPTANRKG